MNLDSLILLESIEISGGLFKHDGDLFRRLSRLYASSSNLISITIDNPKEMFDDVSDHGSLQELFACSPRGNPAHRLQRLSLSDIFVVDDVVVSHLSHLTSFKLLSLPYFLHSVHCCHPNHIWVAFRQASIRLEELVVELNGIDESLNDYLASFSGLKKLKLSIPKFDSQASSEACAAAFWSKGFPNHADTLQEFTLNAFEDGSWCFGRDNCSLIARCSRLEQLTLSFLPVYPVDPDFNNLVSSFV